jgi:hypothetical protein
LTEIVTLYKSNMRDPVATLRAIADAIEAGKHGGVGCVAVALMGDTFEIFGMGPDSEGPSVALLFQAATLRFAKTIEEHGR